MKCHAASSVITIPPANARPPPRGVGIWWELRLLGVSNKRFPKQWIINREKLSEIASGSTHRMSHLVKELSLHDHWEVINCTLVWGR